MPLWAESFIGTMVVVWIVFIIGGLILGGIMDTVKNLKEGTSSWPLWGRILLIIVAILLFPIFLIGGIALSANKHNRNR